MYLRDYCVSWVMYLTSVRVSQESEESYGRSGSQAVILPQIFRTAAMRCEAARQLASWRPPQIGQQQSLAR